MSSSRNEIPNGDRKSTARKRLISAGAIDFPSASADRAPARIDVDGSLFDKIHDARAMSRDPRSTDRENSLAA